MSGESAKLFKRQSGEFKATMAEVREALEATRAVVDRVQSDPPPPVTIRPLPLPRTQNRFDSEAGTRYSLIQTPAYGFAVLLNEDGKPVND